jgi:uncharacterized protein involved in exopolysaccharide biosynthesis
MDLRFYLSIFLRRLPWFLLMLSIGSAIGLTLARMLPAVYVAEARLVVEGEQIPDELAASTVQTPATEQLQIIQQRITAREPLIEMANRLRIYEAEGRPLPADEIVEDLRERITITTTGGDPRAAQATLVSVRFEAPTAQLAATVTNDLVTQILSQDVGMRTNVARQTLDFFEQEVTRLDQELARLGDEILKFKQENAAALPDSLEFRRSQQAAAQERLQTLDRQEAELTDRRELIVQLRDAAAASGTVPVGTQATPEEQALRALQDQLTSLRAVLAPANPRIRMLEAQVAAQEEIVNSQRAAAAGVAGTDADGTPIALSPFDLQIADLDSQLSFVATQRTQIEAQLADLAATIAATPQNAIALGTLERDFANTQAQYDDAVAKKAQAETGEVIEALAKGQRITVIEQAVAPTEPDRPNRVVLAAGGIGGGFALGLGLVLLLELLNKGIRRPVELTSGLGITAFATLPYMRTRRDILRRRLIVGGALAVALAGIPVALWLVHTYYLPLDLLIDRALQRVGLAGLPALVPVL